jgi:hypothetical protein
MSTVRSIPFVARRCAGALFLLASLAASAKAQWTIGLGAAVPIGSSADRLNAGYNATVSYAVRPRGMSNFVRLEGAVNALTAKTVLKEKREVASWTANLVIVPTHLSTPPAGYVIVGAGSYQKTGAGGRESDLGFNAGAGIRFSMGFFGTFVEARLHYINDGDRTKYFPMTFGLTF